MMKCPRCGSKNIAEILYGMPDFSEELESEIVAGKILLGGCASVKPIQNFTAMTVKKALPLHL